MDEQGRQPEKQAWEAEMFRLLAENVKDYAIFIVDPHRHILSWNRGAERLLGFSEAEIVGRQCDSFFTPEDVQSGVPQRELDEALATGRGDDDRWHLRKDGSRFWASGTVTPLRDEGGLLRGFAKIMRDRTELKRAEEAAEERDRQLHLLTDRAPVLIAQCDADRRYKFVNKPYAARLGLHPREVVGRRIPDVLGGPAYAAIERHVDAALAGERVEFEVEVPHGGQGPQVMRCAYDPEFDGGGRVEGFVAAIVNVTAARRAREALRESEERLRTLSDNLPHGAVYQVVGDAEGRRQFTFISAGVERLFGVTPAEALADANALYGLVHEGDRTRVMAAEEAALRDSAPFDCEFRSWARSGGVHARSAPRRLPTGQVVWEGILTDVTARKHAEEELAASRGRLQALFDNTLDAVLLADDQARYLDANPAACTLLGLDHDDLLRRTVFDITPPQDAAAGRAAWDAFLREGSQAGEYAVRRPDGTRVVVEYRAVAHVQPGLHLSVLRDVTERERLVQEVRAERGRLADVFQQAPSFMCVLAGPDHVFERANDRYRQLVGHRDLIGKPVREALPEVEGQGFFELLDAVYRTGDAVVGSDVRVLLARQPGHPPEERYVDFVYQPTRDPHGAVTGVLAQGVDLTDRKRAEVEVARLHAESDRLRRLYETALSNTIDFNYTFDLAGRFTFVNKALLDLWGKGLDEAVGKDFFDLGYPPELADRLQRQIRQVVDTRQPIRDETPYTSAAGERQYEYIFVPVAGAGGAVEAVAGSTRDITDRKALERTLRDQADRLRDADRRKDEFLAVLAHELRNPLAPLRNALQVIRLSPDRDAREHARTLMERQLEQMVRLVDDLLDVSRISRGKLELRRERVDLARVVQSAVETSRPLIEQMGHELAVVLPQQPVDVDADLTRLAQVFLNLLNNSAKYTEPGGRIRLTAGRQGGDVVVAVQDTGIGIPADKLPGVFDLFSQVEGAMSRSQGGLGIGLSLVKRLVEMHGGSVEARSDGPGKGSTFTVRLPAPAGEARPARAGGREEAPRSTLRILVVDDNRDGADSLAMMLRLLGNDTLTAYDGVEGVAAAGTYRPDVVLLDIGLPGLSGHDACRRIREQPWGEGMTLIAVTGWGQEDDVRRSHDAGFDRHMVKPVDPDALMKLLASLPHR
jgi:PAS domain S-box-containing protein